MSHITRKPAEGLSDAPDGKYEKFNLTENPFPSSPAVNQDAEDKRFNGEIYEMAIRKKEYERVVKSFINIPMNQSTHLRMGYLMDTSYIGRGNGKSAFLINLKNEINIDYCDALSEGKNKCAALIINPEAGGRTKSFHSFLDLVFKAMIHNNIIDVCLTVLRYQAIIEIDPKLAETLDSLESDELIDRLGSTEWYSANEINYATVQTEIFKRPDFSSLPAEFPLKRPSHYGYFESSIETTQDFADYYFGFLKKSENRIEFLLSEMVILFKAADYTGMYLFVDDFERIPDFQSARQKRDFAFEIRRMLYDGPYLSAKYGFYVMLLVIHAGLQGLLEEAWNTSGLEHRSPLGYQENHPHIIRVEKMNEKHTTLLLTKYLSEYRFAKTRAQDINPFSKASIKIIGEKSEFNAAKILKLAHSLIEYAADDEAQELIDDACTKTFLSSDLLPEDEPDPLISDEKSVDLTRKIRGKK